jgi:hypothetical protein
MKELNIIIDKFKKEIKDLTIIKNKIIDTPFNHYNSIQNYILEIIKIIKFANISY